MKIDNKTPKFLRETLSGKKVRHKSTKIGDLVNVFENDIARKKMHPQTVYEVDFYMPVKEGTEGGLFFGVTRIYPGKVGNEYFMTRGHFHARLNRAEFYWGIGGEGLLLLMDSKRSIKIEKIKPGTLHYIPGCTAHRVVNTGTTTLSFGACWPSDAGHDYQTINDQGFSARVLEVEGKPTLKKIK